MTKELVAILDRREMGRFVRDVRGRVSFTYNEEWQNAADTYPLSLSMPLPLREHGHAETDTFLWGLLPDNEKVLDQWGKKFQVSARNALGLIAAVGEDCAGAVQFIRPERLDIILGKDSFEIDWLTVEQIAQRLHTLREDSGACASLETRASSVLRERSRKRHCSSTKAGGASLPVECQPHTF